MTRKHAAVGAALLVLICISALALADTIELKSGKVIEGTIVEETPDLVAVDMAGKTGFFSKEDIKSINRSRLDIAQGKIQSVKGQVEVLPKGETEWKSAGRGTSLNEGDKIRSGPESNAVATIANQLIVAVEKDSTVELEKLQQSRKTGINVKVNLEQGQLWNDVGKLRNKRSAFFIETPQAVTGVRGTVFTVQITPEASTKVAVVKGTVDVRTRGMMMTPTKIAANKMTDVLANVAPAAPTAISKEFLAQWKHYEGQFRWLRLGMLGSRFGLSPMQSLIAAIIILVVLMVLVRLLFLRRRKSAS